MRFGRANGVQARAAKLLGISERSLWYRIKKHKLLVRDTARRGRRDRLRGGRVGLRGPRDPLRLSSS